MKTTIVLPTYNERENLSSLIATIAGLPLTDWEALVVDDQSPDGTGEIAESLKATYPIRVIHRSGPRGLAPAVVDGLRAANGPYCVVMDADRSHDPAIIPALVAELERGADLVVGSRFAPGGRIEGWPLWRRAMSRVATLLAQLLFAVSVRDPMSGYFAVRREFFERVASQLRPRGYKILLELLVRGRPSRVPEIGFVFRDRRYGKSKISGTIIREYLKMLVDLRRR